eukprot:m.4545 g.4545  ORF g.4545 m.4545 type:complete len:205 (-) comp4515_c0_seq1:606-1220(-)
MASSVPARARADIKKLVKAGYDVQLIDDQVTNFIVLFEGPSDSPYANGKWRVNVRLPDAYPFKSPSIGFLNKIFHPNIDERSGSICLDVLNQTWTPMYELLNVFDTFLPQLLLYPNPTDPLNGTAARLHLADKAAYEQHIREHVKQHATDAKDTSTSTASSTSKSQTVSDSGDGHGSDSDDADDDEDFDLSDPEDAELAAAMDL